tara:strand:+ start:461 stop:1501 length:1041 start_codon:yes stop_codon:yes gene_type:complete
MSRYQSGETPEENKQPEPKLHTKDKYFDPMNPQKATPLSTFDPETYAPKSKNDKKWNVLIVGHGYVGSAVASIFNDDEKTIIDPRYNDNKISDFTDKEFDAVFVCVDTPEGDKFTLLNSVLLELNEHMLPGTAVCCKSTASPQFYQEAADRCSDIRVLFSPEYLNATDPVKMFQEQKFYVIGGDVDGAHAIHNIFKDRLHHVDDEHVRLMDIRSAALHKYAVNFFLSLRVTFFNELYLQHKFQGCDSIWELFVESVGLDERVGHYHNKVPGADRKFGWSSHCLDKDAAAFEEFSSSPLVKFVRELNDLHREYNGGPVRPVGLNSKNQDTLINLFDQINNETGKTEE